MTETFHIEKQTLDSSSQVEISKDEYYEGQRARALAWHAIYMEEKFDLFMRNLIAFERALIDIALNQALSSDHTSYSIRDGLAQINLQIVNLLSTGRLYVDQSEHHYSKMAMLANLDPTALQSAKSSEYDSSFGYRVSEALRNHVQHFGLPVHKASFEAKNMEQTNTSRQRYSVSPYISKTELEKNPKFKKAILAELQAGNDGYDLKLILRAYATSLGQVHESYREITCESVSDARVSLTGFVQKFPGDELDLSRKSISLALIHRQGSEINESGKVLLDLTPIDRHDTLQRKNCHITNIEAKYISTEITSDA